MKTTQESIFNPLVTTFLLVPVSSLIILDFYFWSLFSFALCFECQ